MNKYLNVERKCSTWIIKNIVRWRVGNERVLAEIVYQVFLSTICELQSVAFNTGGCISSDPILF